MTVARLVRHLDIDDPDRQVACCDQDAGTAAVLKRAVGGVTASPGHGTAPRILWGPAAKWFAPSAWVSRGRGLLFGSGLMENVRQMCRELGRLYEGPDYRVVLSGFSRGAFTVWVLAGLLYRGRLPSRGQDGIDERPERARSSSSRWSRATR